MSATVAATDIGFLTTISKKTGSNYVPFAEITELTTPTYSRDSVDFTHFGSPDAFREFKPGLTDAGDLGLTYNLVPGLADDAVVATHFASRLVEVFRITWPNGATLDINGFATKHARATPMADKMTGSATIKVSGKPTLTPAV